MRLLILSLALLATSCSRQPNRWEAAEQRAEVAQPQASDAPAKIEGGKLNTFFPAAGPNGATRVFTAEKDGYVEAKLQQSDGAELALLSISQANPEATKKFAAAADAVQGFPLVTVGSNQSSVLVNQKFQVKVSSKLLDATARKELLAQFNLRGLASL